MTPNIPLIRYPRPEDFEDVMGLAQKECHCNSDMKSDDNLERADETICKTCGARQVLNGLTSLADTLE